FRVVARDDSQQLAKPEIEMDIAPRGATHADRRHSGEVPRPRLKAVDVGCERAHRAKLDGVAGEIGVKGLAVGRGDVGLVRPLLYHQMVFLRNLPVKACAPAAEDAALLVKDDELTQVDRLGLSHLRSEEHTSELQ